MRHRSIWRRCARRHEPAAPAPRARRELRKQDYRVETTAGAVEVWWVSWPTRLNILITSSVGAGRGATELETVGCRAAPTARPPHILIRVRGKPKSEIPPSR